MVRSWLPHVKRVCFPSLLAFGQVSISLPTCMGGKRSSFNLTDHHSALLPYGFCKVRSNLDVCSRKVPLPWNKCAAGWRKHLLHDLLDDRLVCEQCGQRIGAFSASSAFGGLWLRAWHGRALTTTRYGKKSQIGWSSVKENASCYSGKRHPVHCVWGFTTWRGICVCICLFACVLCSATAGCRNSWSTSPFCRP